MTNNFVKQIERYLLETFSKEEGNFGYKPLMHPNNCSDIKGAHEQLKKEGMMYLENEQKESIASIHPKRGITFIALVTDNCISDYYRMWKITIKNDQRITISGVDENVTTKGVAVLGEIDIREVQDMECDSSIYFHTYDKKMYIEMECHRDYPETIYAGIKYIKG